jgi:hypothetical protein
MSLFQCGNCGCCENTALAAVAYVYAARFFDYTGIEDRKDKLLCSACGPTKFGDGTPTKYGTWHGQFARTFLPKGKFQTNRVGNLEHTETGSENYHAFAIACEEQGQ